MAIPELEEGVHKTGRGTKEAILGKQEGTGQAKDKDVDMVEGKEINASGRGEEDKDVNLGLAYVLLIKTP